MRTDDGAKTELAADKTAERNMLAQEKDGNDTATDEKVEDKISAVWVSNNIQKLKYEMKVQGATNEEMNR